MPKTPDAKKKNQRSLAKKHFENHELLLKRVEEMNNNGLFESGGVCES